MAPNTVSSRIPVSVVLDSGFFINTVPPGECQEATVAEVGYFEPTVWVFGDGGRLVYERDLSHSSSANRAIEIRHLDKNGKPETPRLTYTKEMCEHLLRVSGLYPQGAPPLIPARFDWIIKFQSGVCRPANIKARRFKKLHGYTNQPTGETQTLDRLAHDVVLEFDVNPGGRVELVIDGNAIWSSNGLNDTRFDVEIISPHSTAESYYRDALDHAGHNYWLPNQGDPGPMGGP